MPTVYRRGTAKCGSVPFSPKRSGICPSRFTFIKFSQEESFCSAKADLIENVSAESEAFASIWRFANKFNLPLHSATRANTLYSVLTALCSHPKNFSVEKFWSRFFRLACETEGRGVRGNAPRNYKLCAAQNISRSGKYAIFCIDRTLFAPKNFSEEKFWSRFFRLACETGGQGVSGATPREKRKYIAKQTISRSGRYAIF